MIKHRYNSYKAILKLKLKEELYISYNIIITIFVITNEYFAILAMRH